MEENKYLGIEELAEKHGLDRNIPGLNAYIMTLITREQDKDRQIEEARNKAIHDNLAGLKRKENLYPFLEQELARADRHDEDLSVLMIDADYFKNYNDKHGHLQGDEALKVIVATIENRTRKEDSAFRYGGEEFCVVLPETSAEDLSIIAENLRKSIEDTQLPKAVKDKELDESYKRITVSIGGFTYNPSLDKDLGFLDENMGDEDKVKTLVGKADEALYEAKKQGRNQYCVAEAE